VSFHVKVIAAVAAVIALASAWLLLFRTSDEAAIEALLREGAAAAERGDADAVLALVSKDYRNGGEDRAAVEAKIRRAVGQRLGLLEVSGAAVQVSGDAAEATCVVTARALQHELGSFGLKLKLGREKAGWRVTSAEERAR
jgi:hypothetical protein